jgi:hypothetical protein
MGAPRAYGLEEQADEEDGVDGVFPDPFLGVSLLLSIFLLLLPPRDEKGDLRPHRPPTRFGCVSLFTSTPPMADDGRTQAHLLRPPQDFVSALRPPRNLYTRRWW